MHHLYPIAKGDPLCPLGFHPQVRWPTRCKRCFRDYKEHGGRKEEASRRESGVSASTPALATSTQQRSRESSSSSSSSSGFASDSSRSRVTSSTSDLSRSDTSNDLSTDSDTSKSTSRRAAASWTSTPNLNNLDEETTSVTIRIPLRSRPKPITVEPPKETPKVDDEYRSAQYTIRRRTTDLSHLSTKDEKKAEAEMKKSAPSSSVSTSTSAPRSRRSFATSTRDKDSDNKVETIKRNGTASTNTTSQSKSTSKNSSDVDFMLKVKSTNSLTKRNEVEKGKSKPVVSSSSSSSEDTEESEDDTSSITATDTTDTTIVANDDELMELKRELDTLRVRCEKLEREKSDILLRRLAGARETAPSSGEALKLQQRVHELQQAVEDLRDEKHSLSLRCKELEEVADVASTREPELRRTVEDLKTKLSAAETLCEELMDENEEVKKEIHSLEEEIDEMQDNFREDQANEYTSLKKELEQTAKNCRILQFKLRKADRKAEALEAAKLEIERQMTDRGGSSSTMEKVRTLEKDLKLQSDVSERLQKEVEGLKVELAKEKAAVIAAKLNKTSSPSTSEASSSSVKKKSPMLGKSPSGEPVTRASLTRGGSQDDPVQLLRDLQDSMEREADLREQLRFAEEEAQSMRKKCSRLEDDNDSLAMQLKKMATKARNRRHSPSPARLTPEPKSERDEGISDDDDPAELRLQLELNEQETTVLRRKLEDLEKAEETAKNKVKELQEQLAAAAKSAPLSPRLARSDLRPAGSSAAVLEKKITVLEEECSELRKKLIEKERDYERIQTELTLSQKKSKMSRSRSLDGSEQALDLKRQLQVIEQEAVVLRSKTQDLEALNDKLTAENKRLGMRAARSRTPAIDADSDSTDKKAMNELKEKVKELEKKLADAESSDAKSKKPISSTSDIEKLRTQITKLEKENENLKEGGARLRTRTPKKPTDLTTKLQMKKMVEELEAEVAELLVGISKNQTSSKDSTPNKASSTLEKEVTDLKKERDDLKKELDKEKSAKEKEKVKIETDLKKITSEKTKAEESLTKLQTENKKLKDDLEKVKSSTDTAKSSQLRISKLENELEEAKALATALKREQEDKISEETKKIETEKAKLLKEVADKTKLLADAEKKTKEIEEKLKKTEKISSGRKDKLAKADKDLECEREKVRQSEATHKEVSLGWLRERDELKSSNTEFSRKVDQLKEQLAGRVREVETLESSLAVERTMVAELKSSKESSIAATSAAVEKQLSAARDEIATAKSRATDLSSQLEKAEKAKKLTEEKLRKEITELQSRLSDTESTKASEKQRLELQVKEKEKEIRSLENQLKTAQADSTNKRVAEVQDELNQKIKKLENKLSSVHQEYEELTARYELLEEEHVVTKAQLTMDRDKAETDFNLLQEEFATLEGELKALRDTYNNKQDSWIKEKLDMQEQLKEFEEKVNRGGESWHHERTRLKDLVDEKNNEIEKIKHELDVLSDQYTYTRKESEDLKRKLEDFDKVSKIQRNITADTNAMTKEIKDLKSKLASEEKNHKSESAQLKMRYDSRVALLSEEMQSLQTQMAKFKRERDSHRHMLEAAQKTIGELRQAAASGGKITPSSLSSGDESEETRTKIASLEQQLACMEDELSEARLESSKYKTELISERSSFEVKISEMQSRLNEFEEDRLISTGRTKIPGIKTRMELAWQKEREEQHRLLQETSTLARDLRQTLFEVERERDKERLEGKRKLDQLKKNMEEEMEDNRKKITEMQYDLLELRDAHAKLRTTNEKLRRERERWDKERDDQRQQTNIRRRQEIDEERKINSLLEQVDDLMRLAPDLFPQKVSDASGNLPVAPKRLKGPRSRESSPGMERKDYSREPSVGAEDRKQQIHTTLQRLTEATTELRRYQKLGEDEKDRERARRTLGFRRAASTEAEPAPNESQVKSRNPKANGSNNNKQGSLFRKSLSLEQTGGISQDQTIWTGDDSGSMNSLQSAGSEIIDTRYMSLQRRDPSVDRLSTDSTQSEALPDKKKKKGIFGKLKSLKKSKSIEDSNTDLASNSGLTTGSMGGSGSDISMDMSTTDVSKSGKKDMKGRLAGMFKKGNSSRSSSVERSSVDRDVPSTDKKGSTNALSRPSPARSDTSQTSSASRPLAPTLAQQPKPTVNTTRKYVR